MEGSVRAAIRVIRRDAARRRALGGDARETIAELRPHTQRLWRALPTAERRRFLARVRPFWDVHRHRMPPEVAREIGALRAAGTLSVFAGTLSLARAEDDRVALAWRRRGTAIDERGLFARVVNATGPSPDLRASTSPLVVALRGRGWLVPDPLGLGISTEDDGALVTADPRARGRLFTLGPPRLGDLWETTAIPEVRVQAIALASRLRRVDA
jgi:uncharacterized NAD(P)/FAD-binding protein YdhS